MASIMTSINVASYPTSDIVRVSPAVSDRIRAHVEGHAAHAKTAFAATCGHAVQGIALTTAGDWMNVTFDPTHHSQRWRPAT